MAISLKAISGFHLGGGLRSVENIPPLQLRRVAGEAAQLANMNGEHSVGQLYAQHFELEQPLHSLPVLLWHGGGMTGACWETTPSGLPGWLDFFLRAGHSVYLVDAFERGRASWPPFPEVLPDRPEHRPLATVWNLFRFGAEGDYTSHVDHTPYPGLRFPIQHLEQFARQMVPRWGGTEAQALEAYGQLLQHIGPCIVIGHSQGANYALICGQRYPELVKAVVAVEPSAVPTPLDAEIGAEFPPHLWVWGDYIVGHPLWERYLRKSDKYLASLQERRIPAHALHLPELGMSGNSHMLIMDDNNCQIASLIYQWLHKTL